MSDFSHLNQLNVQKGMTATYTLYQISDAPVLTVTPATEANKPYFNAVLKRSRKMANAIRSGAMNTGMLEQNRSQDRALFPKFVVSGWEGVKDAKGKDVKFTPDTCAEFLNALPNWIFDEIRDFAATPGNFVEQIDAEEAAKN